IPPSPPGQPPRTNAMLVGGAAIPPAVPGPDFPPPPPGAPKLPPAPPPPPFTASLAPSPATQLASSAPAPRRALVLDALSVPATPSGSGARGAGGREPIAEAPCGSTTMVSAAITQIVGPAGCACA